MSFHLINAQCGTKIAPRKEIWASIWLQSGIVSLLRLFDFKNIHDDDDGGD